MATATELLASSNASKSDSMWFDIDLTSRAIVIPKQITNLGVRSDADAMKVRFRLPRFYGDIDFAKCRIGIDYTNAEGEEDRYEPDDVTATDETVTFSWIVGRHAAMYEGVVTFGLCIKQLDPADPTVPIHEFHTTKASLPILEGMETCEEAIIEYTDLFEQWRAQLFGEKDSLIAEINEAADAKTREILATIPDDYTKTNNRASEAIRTKADAIVETAEGDTIIITDASDDYLRDLHIFGKSTQVRSTGAQLVDVNGLVGAACPGSYIVENHSLVAGTLTASITSHNCTQNGFTLNLRNDNGVIRQVIVNGELTFELTQEEIDATTQVIIYPYSGTTGGVIDTLMINVGSTALPYEPYTNAMPTPAPNNPSEITKIGNPTVYFAKVNMIPSIEDTVTNCGVTYTKQSDGSIVVNGTATAYSTAISKTIDAKPFRGKTMALLGSGLDTNLIVTQVRFTTTSGASGYKTANGVEYATFEIPNNAETIRWEIYVPNGKTITNVRVYPYLVLGDNISVDQYEPYVDWIGATFNSIYGLPGIPVTSGGNYTDANGQQWICDEMDFGRGVYIQRVNTKTFTGQESWLIGEQNADEGYLGVFYTAINDAPAGCAAICNRYVQGTSVGLIGKEGQFDTYYSQFRINIADYTSPDEWKAQLAEWSDAGAPLTLMYILATPIESKLNYMAIGKFPLLHTNYPNTTVLNDSGAWMEVDYNVDLKTNLSKPANYITLIDSVTGTKYNVCVSNGQLVLEAAD